MKVIRSSSQPNHVFQEDHRGLTWNVVIENQWTSFQQCQNVLELHTSSLSTSLQLSVLKRPRIARQSIHRREAAMAIRRVPPTLPSALKARYLARALRRLGLCTRGSQAFRSLTGPCDQHWQALNIGRCEDFTGVQKCIKVHEWIRMVIDDNWSAKLQMSALVALSTWSGFRATSFCPLTSLHNATWAHCQQMCKRCARQGLESSVSGQFLQKYVAYFFSDVAWTRGFCQWYARLYHTSFHFYSICIALAVLQVIGVKDLSELMEKLGFKLV